MSPVSRQQLLQINCERLDLQMRCERFVKQTRLFSVIKKSGSVAAVDTLNCEALIRCHLHDRGRIFPLVVVTLVNTTEVCEP